MSEEKDTKMNKTESETKVENKDSQVNADSKTESKPDVKRGDPRQKREFTKNRRNPRNRRGGKPRSEFEQKILDIRRVTRVSKGGRRFSFSVAVVVGNKRGKIGVGTGKAGDTALAIDKAVKSAEKNSILIKTTKDMSIPHDIEAKFNSARVMIMPAPGRGIIAGSALRDMVELGGLKDINGKIISGSKNKLNIAKATIAAFESLNDTVKTTGKAAQKPTQKSAKSDKAESPKAKK